MAVRISAAPLILVSQNSRAAFPFDGIDED